MFDIDSHVLCLVLGDHGRRCRPPCPGRSGQWPGSWRRYAAWETSPPIPETRCPIPVCREFRIRCVCGQEFKFKLELFHLLPGHYKRKLLASTKPEDSRDICSGVGTVWAMWSNGPPTFSPVWAWPTHFSHYLFFTTEVGHVGELPLPINVNVKKKKKNQKKKKMCRSPAHPLSKSFCRLSITGCQITKVGL